MTPPKVDCLILGLGNLLCGDDGAGVVAVHHIVRDYAPPEGAVVLDGGTLGLSLLPQLQDARNVLLIDAVKENRSAGSLVRLSGDELWFNLAHRLSPHQVGVPDLLQGLHLLGGRPANLVLLGIVPDRVEFGTNLGSAVKKGIPDLVREVLNEVREWGFVFHPVKNRDPVSSARADDPLSFALGL